MLDEPLFPSEDVDDTTVSKPREKLTAQELKKRADIFFHEKILNFGFGSIIFILFLAIILILTDFHAQKMGYNSEMIKECMSLLTYIATAALGFIFGANSK